MPDQPVSSSPPKPTPPAQAPQRSPLPTPASEPAAPRPITPPAGIPVKETDLSRFSPSPAPHIPPSSAQQRQPLPPLSPQIPKPPITVPFAPPKPSSVPAKPIAPSFRSSIRTMEQDLGKAKPGIPQKPISSPPVPGVPAPSSRISIPKPTATPAINIPSDGHDGRKMIWFVVAMLAIAIIVALFFLFRGSSEPEPSPTIVPTSTPTPTPTPIGLEQLFPLAGSFSGDMSQAIRDASPLSVGEIRMFTTGDIGVAFPSDIAALVDPQSPLYFTLFGKPDGFKGRGFVVRITDASLVQAALATWEPTMARDLKSIFELNTQRSASANFLSATHQGILVKYRNFPDAWSTVDYTVLILPDGRPYLVFTNTRDHMFAFIDRAIGIVLGK